ncbi:MAG: hypothetical protein V1740_04715 [Candidatus Woesearchaeota archaeon]
MNWIKFIIIVLAKSLYICYNFCYNLGYIKQNYIWIEELLKGLDRKNADITFSLHLFDRKEYWNLDLDNIKETVRNGKIFIYKCEKPNKICFKNYYGKENITYNVIARYHKKHIEVVTAWPNKGR